MSTPLSDKLIARLKNINHLEGWCTTEKAEHMAQIILDRRPHLIVEIGVFGGRSAIAMGMACQEAGCGEVIGIDPWTKAAAVEGGTSPENDEWWSKLDYEKIYSGALGATRALGVDDVVRFERTHDTVMLGEFLDGTIDLLHYDGNHAELVSTRTVRDWSPKMRTGGILLVDDSHWPSMQRSIELLNTELGYRHLETKEFRNDQDQISMQYMVFEKL